MLHLIAAFVFSFSCQPAIRDGWLCCSMPSAQAQTTASCPLPTQFPLIVNNANVNCFTPGQAGGACGNNGICIASRENNQNFICCQSNAGTGTPTCPNGGIPQPSINDQYVDCTFAINSCTLGYTCVTAANVPNVRMCCSTSTNFVCPNNVPLYRDTNGSPRFCLTTQPAACPAGYSCQAAASPSNAFVCCTSNSNPTCPANFQPSRNPSGVVIFCSPQVPAGCPAGAVCLLDSTTGLSLCCTSSNAQIICPIGQNALIINNQPQMCSGPGQPCPSPGYSCTFNNGLSQYFCCGASTTPAVCADGRQTFTQTSGQTYTCNPLQPLSGCPFGYDCSQSTQAGISVCCFSSQATTTVFPPTSFNQCPNGWNPYRNSISQTVQYCSSPTDQTCPIGYSCTPTAQVSVYICCQLADSPRCPVGTTPEFNGRPRLCNRNAANQCPRGFSCQQSTISSLSICCSTQFSDTILCPDLSTPAMVGGNTQYCPVLGSTSGCPTGYNCQLSNKGINVCCMSSFPIARARQAPSSSLPKCPSGVSPSSSQRSCTSNIDCGVDSTCVQGASMSLCCANEVPRDTRCKARRTLLRSLRPVECLAGSTCSSGYECSFDTSNNRGVCCETPDSALSICPENRAAFLVARTEEPMYCDERAYMCPNGQECVQARDGLRHVCCSPIARCPVGTSVSLGDSYPIRCFSSDSCPMGQACVSSSIEDIRVCCNVVYRDEKPEKDEWVVIEG